MEERHPDTAHDEATSGEFARRLAARRHQAKQLLAAQRERTDGVATQFQQRLSELEARIALGTQNESEAQRELAEQLALFQQRGSELREREEDLSLREAQLATDKAEIASRQAELQMAREQ